MKVFITGGSGFIGTNLAHALIKKKYQVTIYDNYKNSNLNSKCNFIKGDILDFNKLKKSSLGSNIIFHLAGIADIDECIKNPIKTINLNIVGTTNMLESARVNNIKRFMFGSSMYVYNDLASFYSLSKKISEMLIEEYSKNYNFKYTFLRYGSLYGSLSQEWNPLKKYINEIIKFKSINYHGTGEETREYIHVDDAIRLTINCIEKKYSNKAVIITGQQSFTSKEILELIFEILNFNPQNIKYKKNKKKEFHYNITPYKYKIQEATRIVPNEFIDLGSGILELIHQIKK